MFGPGFMPNLGRDLCILFALAIAGIVLGVYELIRFGLWVSSRVHIDFY